jgi:hypothetical protein
MKVAKPTARRGGAFDYATRRTALGYDNYDQR